MIECIAVPMLAQGLDALAKIVKQNEDKNKRTLVFCEDRLTLLAEQTICQAVGGSFLCDVTTFSRYLGENEKVLSAQGSVMAIGKIMTEKKEELKCFNSLTSIQNASSSLYEMIAQLSASKITPEMLSETTLEKGMLQDKLFDLSLIYKEYLSFLQKSGYVDENRYLSLLPDKIRSDRSIQQGQIIFLEYDSFTAQALDGVGVAMECAENVTGIFSAGNEEIYTNESYNSFVKKAKEYGECKIIKVPSSLGKVEETLRKNLYSPECFSEKTQSKNVDCISIQPCMDMEEEIWYVATQIQKHILNGGRYQDITLLLPNLADYSILLQKIFQEYKIPYYSDEKKALLLHPFSIFLMNCFDVVREKSSSASVQALASNVFFGDSGAYRNYLLKYANYRGGAKREIKEKELIVDYDRDNLVICRDKFLKVASIPNKASGKVFCDIVRSLYQFFEGKKKTETLAQAIDDEQEKSFLLRLEENLNNILLEAEQLCAGSVFTCGEFQTILKNGLQACEISLLPLRQDAVFVGDITASQIMENQMIFALGLDDSVPCCSEDTALISDRDMQKLEEIRIEIQPTIAQVNRRTRQNVCLNLCSFTKSLFLSFSAKEDKGESEILGYVRRLFSDTEKQEDLFLYACSAKYPAMRALFLAKENYLKERQENRKKYSAVYEAFCKNGDKEETNFLLSPPEEKKEISTGENLFFGKGEVSPTLLETYYKCPYMNFTQRGLRLTEREENLVMISDTGSFIHELLEKLAKNIASIPNEDACKEFVAKQYEIQLQDKSFAFLKDTAKGVFAADNLLKECIDIALSVYRQITGSSFVVKGIEQVCRIPEIKIYGKIDRVDECGEYVRVIDYKTGAIEDTPTPYYMGIKLQLPLYMTAVMQNKKPAGMYYFSAKKEFIKAGDKRFPLQGYMNGKEEVIRYTDNSIIEGENSRFYNIKLGDNKKSQKIMEEEDFISFIRYATLCARQGEKELKEGFIFPTPHPDSCGYCKYKGMCSSLGEAVVRDKETCSCKQIIEVVKKESGEDAK